MISKIGGNENITEEISAEFREIMEDAIKKRAINEIAEEDIRAISDMVAIFASMLIMQYQTELLTELRMKLR